MASVATTIIVQFIGLAVFSRQFAGLDQPAGPLQALMPRVSETSVSLDHRHHAPAPAKGRAALSAGLEEAPSVESHTAIILFPEAAFVKSNGWTREPFVKDKTWSFIRLDGDQLTFSDSSAARKADARKSTPRSAAKTLVLTDEISLPHLKKCFNSQTLKKEYRPPEFTGAAAVFTFPEGVAKTRACLKTKDDPASRADTQVTIPLYGDLVISTTKGPKRELILHGGGKIIVGNVPTAVVNGEASAEYSSPHYEVYYEMGEGASGTSGSNFDCARALALDACDGDPTLIREAYTGQNDPTKKYNPPTPTIFQLSDFRCSNTQWP
jgi:hypothetical protein